MTIQNANLPTQRPSLLLDFARTRQLDPRITFSRNSSGTFFDRDGLLKTAPAGVARFDHNPSTGESLGLLVEEARTNSQTNSTRVELFTPYELSIIPNALLAPDGSYTGCALVGNTANSHKYALNPVGYSTSGATYSFSFYAKSIGSRTSLFVGGTSVAWDAGSVTFDLSAVTATATGGFIGSITAAGNGWFRCVATRIANASGYGLNIYLGAFQGDGLSGIGIWGLQAEARSFPTSYIPTPATFTGRASTATFYDANGVIQTAASGVARSNAFFPDSNGVMRPAGLLLEPVGTNLVTYSEQYDNGAWSKNNLTVAANTAAAPDGNSTADKLIESASSEYHTISQNITGFIAGTSYTLTLFAKAGERSRVGFGGSGAMDAQLGTAQGVVFDLTGNGSVIVGGGSASIQKLSNGWYRCAYSWSQLNSGNYYIAYGPVNTNTTNYSGDGTSGVFIWGAQLEASPYATSYIPTTDSTVTRAADTSTSAAVTRSADVAEITGNNFSSWYNQRAGTWLSGSTGDGFILTVSTNASNRYFLQSNSGNGYLMQTAGVVQFNYGVSGFTRASIAYSPESSNVATDGTVQAAVNSTLIPTANSLKIGMGVNNDFQGLKRISRLAYWPTRLPNATLQALTR